MKKYTKMLKKYTKMIKRSENQPKNFNRSNNAIFENLEQTWKQF